ncbi:MAG TPA: twin-arginine translocase subunit TatC [bacterium]|nr:twin-arginine translocase subunit TatC [bacterium]
MTIDPAKDTYPYEGDSAPKRKRRTPKKAAEETSAPAAAAAAPPPAAPAAPAEPHQSTEEPKSPQSDPTNVEKRMPFLDHLEELRWRIIWSLLAVVAAAVICYFFVDQIVALLVHPAPGDIKLIFLSPTEAFMTYLKVAGYAGLVTAFPFVAWQFWRFVVPGLYAKERKAVGPIVFFTVICFAVGALFAYFLIIPFGLKFLLSYQSDFLVANITIGKYLTFVVTMLLVFGLVFELPVLAYFLSLIGLLTPQFLRSKRRYGILIIFIVAAILTPPDAFTQLMLAIPLLILYEISIWVSAAVHRKRKVRQAEEEKQWAG